MAESSAQSPSEAEEITARFTAEELQAKPAEWKPAKLQAVLKVAARTDLGRVRENNEDKFDIYEPEDDDAAGSPEMNSVVR